MRGTKYENGDIETANKKLWCCIKYEGWQKANGKTAWYWEIPSLKLHLAGPAHLFTGKGRNQAPCGKITREEIFGHEELGADIVLHHQDNVPAWKVRAVKESELPSLKIEYKVGTLFAGVGHG